MLILQYFGSNSKPYITKTLILFLSNLKFQLKHDLYCYALFVCIGDPFLFRNWVPQKTSPFVPATSDLNSIAPSGIFCTMGMQPLATLRTFSQTIRKL